VLARILEAAGLSTVLVTNMPFWAEKTGVPRTLAVEFPFGHMLGQTRNVAQQTRVISQALEVLEAATEAGTIRHSPESWPVPAKQATDQWQPKEASPLMKVMAPQFIKLMRKRRSRKASG
jgi:D-proline reductase (dithiol) PrdB